MEYIKNLKVINFWHDLRLSVSQKCKHLPSFLISNSIVVGIILPWQSYLLMWVFILMFIGGFCYDERKNLARFPGFYSGFLLILAVLMSGLSSVSRVSFFLEMFQVVLPLSFSLSLLCCTVFHLLLFGEFFTPVLTGSYSLKSEW